MECGDPRRKRPTGRNTSKEILKWDPLITLFYFGKDEKYDTLGTLDFPLITWPLGISTLSITSPAGKFFKLVLV